MATANTNNVRKTPQDHKKPLEELKTDTGFFELEGHELLKPPGKLSMANRMRFIGAAQDAGLMDLDNPDVNDAKTRAISVSAFGDLIDFMTERCALDPEAFEQALIDMGNTKALELVSAYFGELGNAMA